MSEEIIETLKQADNEGTESPYWLLIDPIQMLGRLEGVAHHGEIPSAEQVTTEIAFSVEGPFFSREDAETYLKNRNYAYSSEARVWCVSGYRSRKYKEFYRGIK